MRLKESVQWIAEFVQVIQISPIFAQCINVTSIELIIEDSTNL